MQEINLFFYDLESYSEYQHLKLSSSFRKIETIFIYYQAFALRGFFDQVKESFRRTLIVKTAITLSTIATTEAYKTQLDQSSDVWKKQHLAKKARGSIESGQFLRVLHPLRSSLPCQFSGLKKFSCQYCQPNAARRFFKRVKMVQTRYESTT